jgi:hypothetical protein
MAKTTEVAAMATTAAATAVTAATAAMVAKEPAAAESTTVYADPLLDPALYPSFHEFMTALQDPGEQEKRKGKSRGEMKYPLLMKVLSKTHKVLKEKYVSCGIPKNMTDAKKQIAYQIVRVRQHKDTAALPQQFRDYGKDGKVFIINDDTEKAGLNIVLCAILASWQSRKAQDVEQRNKNDVLRIAAIMLDPKNRLTVTTIMSNLKDRKYQDQAICPTKAFFAAASEDFTSPSYIAKSPALANLIEGHEDMDPNAVSL